MEPTQKLVVRCMSISLDGYAVGPNQRLEKPFGDHTDGLTDWFFATKTGAQMFGTGGGSEGLDDHFLAVGIIQRGAAFPPLLHSQVGQFHRVAQVDAADGLPADELR